ncbi:MAG: hypothetical protein R8J84_08330 [Mariprofundales bacterium]
MASSPKMPAHNLSDNRPGGHDRIGLWMLLLVVVLTAALFFWTRTHYQHQDPSLDTHVDQQGNLHVLGVTLGKTSLDAAEVILQSKSDIALYIYPQEHPKAGLKLEAFFPAIADHSKVILLLDVGKKELLAIESRATTPHLYPNHVARMNLAAKDWATVHRATVRELTLIPNLQITVSNLEARFGQPDHDHPLDGGEQHQYHFDAIGLEATLSKDSPPTFHFANQP